MFSWFKKKRFNPQNAFSSLAYEAVRRHIENYKVIDDYSKQATDDYNKLECYMFYTTYVHLLASFSTENINVIEQLLLKGIYDYKNYLQLKDDIYTSDFKKHYASQADFYSEVIQERIDTLNGKLTTVTLLNFEEADSDIVENNFTWINTSFQNCLLQDVSRRYIATSDPIDFFRDGSSHIDDMVAIPFCLPVCQNCGTLVGRSELEMCRVDTEKGLRRISLCIDCRIKFRVDGRIL
jgi:hypothetical protein